MLFSSKSEHDTVADQATLINSLASINCFCYRNFLQNGVDDMSRVVDTFSCQKAQNFTYSSDHLIMVKILLACRLWHRYLIRNTNQINKELQMIFQTTDVSISNCNINDPIGTFFFHKLLRSSSSMFPLLLLALEV